MHFCPVYRFALICCFLLVVAGKYKSNELVVLDIG